MRDTKQVENIQDFGKNQRIIEYTVKPWVGQGILFYKVINVAECMLLENFITCVLHKRVKTWKFTDDFSLLNLRGGTCWKKRFK